MKKTAFVFLLVSLAVLPLLAAPQLDLGAGSLLPLGQDSQSFSGGFEAHAVLGLPLVPGLRLRLGGSYASIPVLNSPLAGLSMPGVLVGLEYRLALGTRYEAGLCGAASLTFASFQNSPATAVLDLGAGLSLARVFSPDLALVADLGLHRYSSSLGNPMDRLYLGMSLGLGLRVGL